MSNYTPVTIFRAKDSLPSGNSAKVIKGSEFSSEFEAIQTAISTKADTAAPTFTGQVTFNGNVQVGTNIVAIGAGVYINGADSQLGLGAASASERLHIHSGNVLLADNANLKIGTGGDLLAYHDGTNSYVEASNSSDLVIFNAKNNGSPGSYIKFVNDDTASNLSDGVLVGSSTKSFLTGVGSTPFIRAGKDNQPDDLNSLDVFVTDSASFTRIMTGTGTPEGNVTSNVGSIWLRTDGGSGTTLYVKESGTNSNTGWVAK